MDNFRALLLIEEQYDISILANVPAFGSELLAALAWVTSDLQWNHSP